MAITSQEKKAGFPFTLPLSVEIMPKPSWIKISRIRTTLNQIVVGLLELIG